MRTKLFGVLLAGMALVGGSARAGEEHGTALYHAFTLESDYGAGQHGPVARWDLDGWIGGDDHKLWLKAEGEQNDGRLEQSEFWAMYSRNIATFWDVQAGVRHDTQPVATSYVVVGVQGLAPYHIETEAHLFLSEDGDVSARLRGETDFLWTQRLMSRPYAELNLFAQDVADQEVGAGLATAEIGVQTRYEIRREFAPYVDVRYERKLGETSSLARRHGEDPADFIATFGLRLMF